jgi:GT2 family glycosyltransferase
VKISVIICTRDRPDTVGQALESVCQCDFDSYDIHVMDQSTNTQTRDIVEALAARYASKCEIKYHFLEKAGLSRAYNAGVRVSSAEIVACTDDDVIVTREWLSEIYRALEADPQAALLYGQVLIPASLVQAEKEGLIVPSLPILRRERLYKDNFKVFGMGANMAMRRSAHAQIGGFDEALGGGGALRSSQDFDFAYRINRAGMAILLAPEVKVDHYGTRTAEQWPSTLIAYGIGDGAFYSKHIRCGDLFALYLFSKMVVRLSARYTKHALLHRSLRRDPYTENLFTGIRMASKFAVDREHRLYQETKNAKMSVSEANQVTGVRKNDVAARH